MKCKSNNCESEALFRCYWPGQTIVYCARCKEKMEGVAEAMGFTVAVEFVDQAAYNSVTTTGRARDVDEESDA